MSGPSGSGSAAGALLRRQLKQMQSDKDIPGISCGLVNDNNIFEWEVMLMINDDCKYYGGMLSVPPLLLSPLPLFPLQDNPMLNTFHFQEATSAPT